MADIPGLKYDKSKVYHKEFILKKEGKVFEDYYAILVENMFVFNRRDRGTGRLIPNNMTMIEISSRTLCGFEDNKKCYRFPFWIENGKSKYDFKCETRLHRHQWLYAVRLCVSGKPPKPVPKAILSIPKGTVNRRSSLQTSNNRSVKTAHRSISATTTASKTNGSSSSSTSLKRSQSIDGVLSRSTNKQKMSKTSQEELLKRSNSFTEQTVKHVKGHARSKSSSAVPKVTFKLFRRSDKEESYHVKGASKNLKDVKGGSVVANSHAEDSMNDISGNNNNNNNNNNYNNNRTESKNVEIRSSNFAESSRSHNRMTLNDRFKSMSCDDVLSQSVEKTPLEPLVKSINGRRHLEFVTNSEGGVGCHRDKDGSTNTNTELYVDENGRKTPTNYQQVVDLESKKEPTENDELDYEQTLTIRRRDVTELFKATSSSLHNNVKTNTYHPSIEI